MKNKLLVALLLFIALTVAVFAACTPEQTEFTVSFSGEGVSIAAQKIEKGQTALEPKQPERKGYVFKYWYLDDDQVPFDFGTAIEQDITLTAFWEKETTVDPVDPSEISGQGTKEDPYLLQCASHLDLFAKRVNEGDESYANGFFRLDKNIDLNGYKFTPIGTYDKPFKGKFDGNGKTIANLTLQPVVRSDGSKFYGFFGMTDTAVITDLTLSDINIDVQSYKDGDNTIIYIGGVAGCSSLTTFENINVSGNISTFLMADNDANIGGLCGWADNSSDKKAYIVYTENCFVNVQMSIDEADGEFGSLENARVGGLFGVVYNQNCSNAILNCAVYGKVYGGQYTGGIAGYINGLTSVMDCLNTASVEATAKEVTYAGGIVGGAMGDNLIIDCVNTGEVIALKAAANSYNYLSYAGGITGYATKDDYENYFTAGSSVVNCYYTVEAKGADKISAEGTIYAANYFSKLQNYFNRVKWNAACWITDENIIKPSDKTAKEVAADGKYVLTLQNGSTETNIDKASSINDIYTLIGVLDELPALDNNVFWNWEIANGVQYKYYAPVIKNTTLTAKWQDVSGIAKSYKGTGTLHSTVDAGSIVLYADGSLQWITDSAVGGTYKYDGTHILLSINNNTGKVSGTISGNALTFVVDAGMSGSVTYNFAVYEPKIIGEYISDNGNLLTFAGDNRVSYESEFVNNGAYVSGTYQSSGNTLTPMFAGLGNSLTVENIVIQDDTTIVFNFTQGGESKTETFRKLGKVDYSGQQFVGEYNFVWFGSPSYSNKYVMRFDADGTVTMISEFNQVKGRYYYISSSDVLKTILEGYVSNFKYDAEEDIVYGELYRGKTTFRPVVMNKIARGSQKVFSNFDSTNVGVKDVFIFAVADGKNYSYFDGQYSVMTVDKPFASGAEVKIGDNSYRIYDDELKMIGADRGEYTYGDIAITLDGVDRATITGENAGTYYYVAHSDNIVTIVLDTQVIVFDYAQAQANNNIVVEQAPDKYQGVWFKGYKDDPYYNKLVFDGFGHATVFYIPQDETKYKLNWGSWGSYTVTSYGVLVSFNSSNKDIRFMFYYDGNLAYSPDIIGGSSNNTYIAKGYTGATTPPVFPANKAGSYVSGEGANELVLNLREDLSGTYRGNPIYNVIYDGVDKVYFTCNSVNYTFTLTQNGGTLDYGADPIEFTLAGAVTEVIPSALCGLWTGVFEGYGTMGGQNRGFSIESDGVVYYYSSMTSEDKTQMSNVNYDFASTTLTFTDNGGFTWTLVYDAENKQINVTGINAENTTITAVLTKTAE